MSVIKRLQRIMAEGARRTFNLLVDGHPTVSLWTFAVRTDSVTTSPIRGGQRWSGQRSCIGEGTENVIWIIDWECSDEVGTHISKATRT